MTWSSYALEDLGDSFVADPDPTSCNTASNTARLGDIIRHVSDQPITLSCSNKVRCFEDLLYKIFCSTLRSRCQTVCNYYL